MLIRVPDGMLSRASSSPGTSLPVISREKSSSSAGSIVFLVLLVLPVHLVLWHGSPRPLRLRSGPGR